MEFQRTTLGDLVRSAQTRIAASGSSSPRLDAEVLLRHLINVDRVGLFMRLEEETTHELAVAFDALVEKRVEGTPVAYLTGIREFMGLTFSVTPDVLIPRPETELLVEWALERMSDRADLTVVDVGTGSGAIAISLATLDTSDHNRIIGSDVSADAIRIAQGNADRLLTPFRKASFSLVQGSLLDWLTESVDLVLANLPYLRPEQVNDNAELAAEPRLALFGGPDGLDLIRELIADLPRVLHPRGAVGLELDPEQIDVVVELLSEAFRGATVEVIPDLAGHRRHVVMTR